MAHVGQEGRFQPVGLQRLVACLYQLCLCILVFLDALADTQHPVGFIGPQSFVDDPSELPPFVCAVLVAQAQVALQALSILLVYAGKTLQYRFHIVGMNTLVQLALLQLGGTFRQAQPLQETILIGKHAGLHVVAPGIDVAVHHHQVEEFLQHLLLRNVMADQCGSVQFVAREDRNHFTRNGEITAVLTGLHEGVLRNGQRTGCLQHGA